MDGGRERRRGKGRGAARRRAGRGINLARSVQICNKILWLENKVLERVLECFGVI